MFSLHYCDITPIDVEQQFLPTHWSVLLFTVSVFAAQITERDGVREEWEEQRKQNGGLHDEEAPKQHRKPERTLR